MISALVDNALGQVAAGGYIWMTLSTGPARTVELTIQDNGVGLDPRHADRLFARFAGGTHGFGLGLALAREVADGHGGTITVGGRPGAGAVFTIRLPDAAAVRREFGGLVRPRGLGRMRSR
jgi:signal transduction histidine kinase